MRGKLHDCSTVCRVVVVTTLLRRQAVVRQCVYGTWQRPCIDAAVLAVQVQATLVRLLTRSADSMHCWHTTQNNDTRTLLRPKNKFFVPEQFYCKQASCDYWARLNDIYLFMVWLRHYFVSLETNTITQTDNTDVTSRYSTPSSNPGYLWFMLVFVCLI